MKKELFLLVLLLVANLVVSQTKVSGVVVDNTNQPVPYANVVFKNSTIGTVTNEDGRFYIESSNTYAALVVSFVGFETKVVPLTKSVNYNFKIQLSDGQQLSEVVIYTGKTSKKEQSCLRYFEKNLGKKAQKRLKDF